MQGRFASNEFSQVLFNFVHFIKSFIYFHFIYLQRKYKWNNNFIVLFCDLFPLNLFLFLKDSFTAYRSLGWLSLSSCTLHMASHCLLASMADEKSAFDLIHDPLLVMSHCSLAILRSLTLTSKSLIKCVQVWINLHLSLEFVKLLQCVY